MKKNTHKNILFYIIMCLLSVIILLISIELLLRLSGRKPWIYKNVDTNEPTMNEPDSILGWRKKPGNYIIPPYHPDGTEIKMTLLKDNLRLTSNETIIAADTIIFIGGSWTLGWAISDSETFTWKIQKKFPSIKVLNYGTGGYGTYQSLLVLETIINNSIHPQKVIYSFNDHHERRNVATSEWLKMLSTHSRRGHISVPYCTIENDILVRHEPERYPIYNLSKLSSTFNFLTSIYVKFRSHKRSSQARSVTQRLILGMNKLCEDKGIEFVVVILRCRKGLNDYYKYFQENNIKYINCIHKIEKGMRVLGEGHPNGEMNSLWTRCILDNLELRN
jgi:hypothetical protein